MTDDTVNLHADSPWQRLRIHFAVTFFVWKWLWNHRHHKVTVRCEVVEP